MGKTVVKNCKTCINGKYNDFWQMNFCYAHGNCVDWNLWKPYDKVSEEQEFCEDCVNRIDVKKQMLKYGFHAPDMTVTEFVEDFLPSVTPKQKIGHWRDTGSGQECSECGEIQYGYDTFRHFCANCGAKMEG